MVISELLEVNNKEGYEQSVKFMAETRSSVINFTYLRYILRFNFIEHIYSYDDTTLLKDYPIEDVYSALVDTEEPKGYIMTAYYSLLQLFPEITVKQFVYFIYLNQYAFHFSIMGKSKRSLVIATDMTNPETYSKISLDSLYNLIFFKEASCRLLPDDPATGLNLFFKKTIDWNLLCEFPATMKISATRGVKKREQYLKERWEQCEPYANDEVIDGHLMYINNVFRKNFSWATSLIDKMIDTVDPDNWEESYQQYVDIFKTVYSNQWYLTLYLYIDDIMPQICIGVDEHAISGSVSPFCEVFDTTCLEGRQPDQCKDFGDFIDTLYHFSKVMHVWLSIADALSKWREGRTNSKQGDEDNVSDRYNEIWRAVNYLRAVTNN